MLSAIKFLAIVHHDIKIWSPLATSSRGTDHFFMNVKRRQHITQSIAAETIFW
jgi:hypothetical protein